MISLLRSCALGLLPCFLVMAEPPAVDQDLPQPFEFNSKVMSEMRTHSPFNRVVSMTDTFKLTGVAYVDGKPMATLMNKDTKQHFVVSEEPNALGWTLTEATFSDEPGKTQVHVKIGPEEVVMHYSEAEVAEASAKPGKVPSLSSSGKKMTSSSSHSGPAVQVDVAGLLGDQGKDKLNALPPEDREKLAAIMSASAEKHPERTKEQLAATAQKIYAKMVAPPDKTRSKTPTSGTPKPPKAEKPKRKP